MWKPGAGTVGSLCTVLGLSLTLAGCWTSTGSVSYAKFNAFPTVDPSKTQTVGEVVGSGSVSYVGFCDSAAESALDDALQNARNMGANALTNVVWEDDGEEFKRPVCGSGFAFYWWGGAADLRATAIKLPDDEIARLKKGVAPTTAQAVAQNDLPTTGLQPPTSATQGANDYAVIIGIEGYQGELPKATHAEADARAFAAYAQTTLGVPASHIKVLSGSRAGKAAIESAVKEWLPRNVRDPNSKVYFFFSGHGAPDPETGTAYLVPWDADPAYLKTRGVSIKSLYTTLETLPAKNLYVFLDACFSGSGSRSVLAKGTRPLVPVKAETARRLVALTASGARETTGAARDMPHGLFTRYLLAGLGGAADANADNAVSVGELADFVTSKVSTDARLDNREQTPSLVSESKAARGATLVDGINR